MLEGFVETYAGSELPSYGWYWDASVRNLFGASTGFSCAPSEAESGYTHTLLFAFRTPSGAGAAQMLLARKLRGFGAGTYNGVGGKVDPDETASECIRRETREEIGVELEPQEVRFAGRLGIRVPGEGGESVRIAVFTTHSEKVQGESMGGEEVDAGWYDVGCTTGGEEEGFLKSIPGQMRPEHRVYLGLLVGHHAQTEGKGGTVFDAEVGFHPQPTRAQLPAGERPENHRTLEKWSLTVFTRPHTDTRQSAT